MAVRLALATSLLLLYGADAALAQSVARNYIEPLITEDTFTTNEADILPGWSRGADSREFVLAVQIEKSIAQNASIEVTGQWDQQSPPGNHRDRTGFDNLEVLPKYDFYIADEHEFRLAAAIDSFFPVGNSQVENNTHYLAGPMLLWTKGMGDLPRDSWLRYLRPIDIQGDGGCLFEFSGSFSAKPFADAILAYNIPYMLADAGSTRAAQWIHGPLKNLVPFSELNYVEFTAGRRGRTPPALFATPGIAYVAGPYQVSVGTQIALNHNASQQDKVSLLGLLNVQLDPIFPAISWNPF